MKSKKPLQGTNIPKFRTLPMFGNYNLYPAWTWAKKWPLHFQHVMHFHNEGGFLCHDEESYAPLLWLYLPQITTLSWCLDLGMPGVIGIFLCLNMFKGWNSSIKPLASLNFHSSTTSLTQCSWVPWHFGYFPPYFHKLSNESPILHN